MTNRSQRLKIKVVFIKAKAVKASNTTFYISVRIKGQTISCGICDGL